MKAISDIIDSLHDEAVSFAEKLLLEYGEIHPFFVAVHAEDDVANSVGMTTDESLKTPAEMVDELDRQTTRMIDEERALAAAVVAGVTIPALWGEPFPDAVRMTMKFPGHMTNVYVPYQLSGRGKRRRVELAEPFMVDDPDAFDC